MEKPGCQATWTRVKHRHQKAPWGRSRAHKIPIEEVDFFNERRPGVNLAGRISTNLLQVAFLLQPFGISQFSWDTFELIIELHASTRT